MSRPIDDIISGSNTTLNVRTGER